jgi:hypothetical protein
MAELLEARRLAGRVRHCHGDLHLANIVLLDKAPVLFDCLEFSEELACTDLLYDLAFLLMDLIGRKLAAQAQALLQTYNDLAPDDAGMALLPLFVSIRAAVRAKVAGLNAGVLQDAAARAAKVQEAGAYLDLARRALDPAPPRLLVVAGRSGTGKSSVARALAPEFGAMPGALLLRSDVIRKRLFGKPPDERLPLEAYAPEVSAARASRPRSSASTATASPRSSAARICSPSSSSTAGSTADRRSTTTGGRRPTTWLATTGRSASTSARSSATARCASPPSAGTTCRPTRPRWTGWAACCATRWPTAPWA